MKAAVRSEPQICVTNFRQMGGTARRHPHWPARNAWIQIIMRIPARNPPQRNRAWPCSTWRMWLF